MSSDIDPVDADRDGGADDDPVDRDLEPAVRFRYVNQAGNRRRVTLARRDPGGWDRVVEELSDGEWRGVGDEIAADFAVEIDAGVLDVVTVVPPDGATGESVTGPENQSIPGRADR